MRALQTKRIASIDIFRAITMLLMLWVNDYAGMSDIPHWMHHAAADEDMLGLSDLVFPAFLFCVGLSLPYAVESRFRRSHSFFQIFIHVLLRSASLVVMGVFSMNMGGIEGGLSGQWFRIIMVVGFFLVWNEKSPSAWLRVFGLLILAALVIYRYKFGHPIKVGWWGILGLIGWAYLACGILYLVARKFLSANIIVLIVLLALMLMKFCGLETVNFYPGGWTHVAIAYCGVVISLLMRRKNFILTGLAISLLSASIGYICHQFWIISKIQATPTWMFYSVAIFVPFLCALYWLADVHRFTIWARPIKAAGTATLTCYTLPYLWYAVQQLLGLHYGSYLNTGVAGLVKAMVFSFVIILLAELLGKIDVKLKL